MGAYKSSRLNWPKTKYSLLPESETGYSWARQKKVIAAVMSYMPPKVTWVVRLPVPDELQVPREVEFSGGGGCDVVGRRGEGSI